MALLPWVSSLLRIILGLWVLGAGVSKLFDLFGFIRIVKSFKVLPKDLAGITAVSYTFIEVLTGLALFLRTLVYPALIIVFIVQILDFGVLVYLLIKKRQIVNVGRYGEIYPVALNWKRLMDVILHMVLVIVLF